MSDDNPLNSGNDDSPDIKNGIAEKERSVNKDEAGSSSNLISRRQFIAGAAALTAAFTFRNKLSFAQSSYSLPDPKDTGVEHIILVMMENRSFDHLLGWLPGADGKQAGLSFMDSNGVEHMTAPLAPEFQGCSHPDPDHSYEGGRVEFNDGACDGWLRASTNDAFSIGYYEQNDLPFLGKVAPSFTVLDRYFAGIMAETYPNRFYQHSAMTDRLHNTISSTDNTTKLPAIWDMLAAKGVSGRYYYSDFPFLALYGDRFMSISATFNQFLADCKSGKLPAVSYVDPSFIGEDQGTSGDDHPHGDIRNGEVFLAKVYKAVTKSPAWPKTVLIINFDEWGGFFDHVPPPTGPIPMSDQMAGNADGRLGFRVPCILVSPFARRGFVSSDMYDHTSILKFIEWQFGLDSMSVRDAAANNIANALDFSKKIIKVPKIAIPKGGPFGSRCAQQDSPHYEEMLKLGELARKQGWPV